MIGIRMILRAATMMTAGTVLACANDVTTPLIPTPAVPTPIVSVFTSLEIRKPANPLAPIAPLNTSWIEVRPKDQNGKMIAVETASFTISSSNPNVLAVFNEQFLTAKPNVGQDDSWVLANLRAIAPGEAVISASWTISGVTKTAKSTISVESTEGWTLQVSPTTLTMPLGATERIHASVLDASGKIRIPYAIQDADLTPDREGVVSVFGDESCYDLGSDLGCQVVNVRSIGVGEATLTARHDFLSAKVVVKVVP